MTNLKRGAVILILLVTQVSFSQSVNLPLNHWVYHYIERMETRGVLRGIRNGSKPFTREKMASFIPIIEKSRDTLSRVESEYLDRMKSEFADEFRENSIDWNGEREPHIYSWKGKPGVVHADAVIGGALVKKSDDAPSAEQVAFSPYYGGILRGRLWNVALYSDTRIHAEFGSRKFSEGYNLSEGYPQNANDDSTMATWDESQSYIAAELKGFRFQFGRDRVQWGPGNAGGLLLSGAVPPIDLLKLSFEFGPVSFTMLHGELRSDYGRKWFAAKRLELTVLKGLDVGLHESVIYGGRGIESAYLNPLLPFLISEHTLGDHDNVGMGVDFDFSGIHNTKLYGELFVDDMVAPWEIFDDYWGNKLAFTIGLALVDPLDLQNSRLYTEYTRIDPFVYTHKNQINTYNHYNIGIGSEQQPNSDRFTAGFEHFFSFRFGMGLQMMSGRRGEGDICQPHTIEDGTDKNFLKGVIEELDSFSANINWELMRDLRLTMFMNFHKYHNFQIVSGDSRTILEITASLNLNW